MPVVDSLPLPPALAHVTESTAEITPSFTPASTVTPSVAAKPKNRKLNEHRPPSIKGVEWSKNRSGGWDCRTFRELPDGTIGERQYVGYLGKRKWEEMRSRYKGQALRNALEAWLREKQESKTA